METILSILRDEFSAHYLGDQYPLIKWLIRAGDLLPLLVPYVVQPVHKRSHATPLNAFVAACVPIQDSLDKGRYRCDSIPGVVFRH